MPSSAQQAGLAPQPHQSAKFLSARTAKALLGSSLKISAEAVLAANVLLKTILVAWIHRGCSRCPGAPLVPQHIEPVVGTVLGKDVCDRAIAAGKTAMADPELRTLIPLPATGQVVLESVPPAYSAPTAIPDITLNYLNAALDAVAGYMFLALAAHCDGQGLSAVRVEELALVVSRDFGFAPAFAQLRWKDILDQMMVASPTSSTPSVALAAQAQATAAAPVPGALDMQVQALLEDSTTPTSAPASAGAGVSQSSPAGTGSTFTGGLERTKSWRGRKPSGHASANHPVQVPAGALDEFEELLQSKGTKKITLTPDRIRTMEADNGGAGSRPGTAGSTEAASPSTPTRPGMSPYRQSTLNTSAAMVDAVGYNGGGDDAAPIDPSRMSYAGNSEVSVTSEDEALGLKPSRKPVRTHAKELADFLTTPPTQPVSLTSSLDGSAAGAAASAAAAGGDKKKRGILAMLRGKSKDRKDKSREDISSPLGSSAGNSSGHLPLSASVGNLHPSGGSTIPRNFGSTQRQHEVTPAGLPPGMDNPRYRLVPGSNEVVPIDSDLSTSPVGSARSGSSAAGSGGPSIPAALAADRVARPGTAPLTADATGVPLRATTPSNDPRQRPRSRSMTNPADQQHHSAAYFAPTGAPAPAPPVPAPALPPSLPRSHAPISRPAADVVPSSSAPQRTEYYSLSTHALAAQQADEFRASSAPHAPVSRLESAATPVVDLVRVPTTTSTRSASTTRTGESLDVVAMYAESPGPLPHDPPPPPPPAQEQRRAVSPPKVNPLTSAASDPTLVAPPKSALRSATEPKYPPPPPPSSSSSAAIHSSVYKHFAPRQESMRPASMVSSVVTVDSRITALRVAALPASAAEALAVIKAGGPSGTPPVRRGSAPTTTSEAEALAAENAGKSSPSASGTLAAATLASKLRQVSAPPRTRASTMGPPVGAHYPPPPPPPALRSTPIPPHIERRDSDLDLIPRGDTASPASSINSAAGGGAGGTVVSLLSTDGSEHAVRRGSGASDTPHFPRREASIDRNLNMIDRSASPAPTRSAALQDPEHHQQHQQQLKIELPPLPDNLATLPRAELISLIHVLHNEVKTAHTEVENARAARIADKAKFDGIAYKVTKKIDFLKGVVAARDAELEETKRNAEAVQERLNSVLGVLAEVMPGLLPDSAAGGAAKARK
ncbi:hypothetical protein H9P43_007875 [Blastocladiella emersonii ATCC 22665]|nr:hypothetical protein H9P43_007875 [Blastocladiella emersonii ATCC 22665]